MELDAETFAKRFDELVQVEFKRCQGTFFEGAVGVGAQVVVEELAGGNGFSSDGPMSEPSPSSDEVFERTLLLGS